jgi:signal transduction histidine kinase
LPNASNGYSFFSPNDDFGLAGCGVKAAMQSEPLVSFQQIASIKNAAIDRGTYAWQAITATWATWSLARQFLTCASLVLLPAMLLIGLWVSSSIRDSVTNNAAASAALYMENFVEPLIQDLAAERPISSANSQALGRLLTETSLGQRVLSFKIWTRGDLIVASSRPELVNQKFTPSHGLLAAWRGHASSEFDDLDDAENDFERRTGVPLLEIYIPLRERGTDRIIAVAEFYEKAHALKRELDRARLLSWLVVGGVTLSMLTALFAIVRRGSETIELQRTALEGRVEELTLLRSRAQNAFARATESNESYMRRLGADLHDGPAQLISLALLRLGAERPPAGSIPDNESICIRQVLTDALQDIRNLSIGFAVPEIDALCLEESMRKVIERHERLTKTIVDFACEPMPVVTHATRLCAYRFVQEGLSNAYRHAGGVGQSVQASIHDDMIHITVADSGNSADPAIRANTGSGLGLRGLADRIESLGGTLHVNIRGPSGTRLTARLPIAAVET